MERRTAALQPIATPLATIAIIAATLYAYFEVMVLESNAASTCSVLSCQQAVIANQTSGSPPVVAILAVAWVALAILVVARISKIEKTPS